MIKLLNGGALALLKTLRDQTINACITSPPYWGLRDYGMEGQLGLEKSPRDETTSKVSAIESKPAQDNKRLDEVEKRLSTVEGAVGSKAYKKAEKAEDKPDPKPPINPFRQAVEAPPTPSPGTPTSVPA